MDQITAFIDASNVYGSGEDEATELRTQRGGRLKVTRVGERDLLPLNTDMMDECTDPQRNLFCFKGGMSSSPLHITRKYIFSLLGS
jgi:hypothetical protein